MDAFDEAGYGVGAVGWGRRPAVVAVDFQLAFTSPEFPLGGSDHIRAALGKAATVVAAARDAGLLVVHTSAAWGSAAQFGRWKIPSLAEITPGSRPSVIDEAVWDPRDVLLYKQYPSAFFGTDLSSVLRCDDVDTVVVVGATTSGCVRATIVDSFSHGFRTVAVSDGCGDQAPDAHESNMRDVGRRYADVVDSATVVAQLGTYAAQPVAS